MCSFYRFSTKVWTGYDSFSNECKMCIGGCFTLFFVFPVPWRGDERDFAHSIAWNKNIINISTWGSDRFLHLWPWYFSCIYVRMRQGIRWNMLPVTFLGLILFVANATVPKYRSVFSFIWELSSWPFKWVRICMDIIETCICQWVVLTAFHCVKLSCKTCWKFT